MNVLKHYPQGNRSTIRIHLLFFIPLFGLFFFLSSFFLLHAQERLTSIFKKIAPSVVVILCYDNKDKVISQGSGFFISQNGDVITNRHVLENADHAKVKISEDKFYPIAQIVSEDEEGDIIRISVNIPSNFVHPLQVTSTIPEVGEEVIVIGSPLGLERTISNGIVSAVRDIPSFGNIIQITASISPGSSGSPVVNIKGEVIGVASFQMLKGQNLNFAIPGERVIKLKSGKGKIFTNWKSFKKDAGIAPEVVYIPAGEFIMGSYNGTDDEKPVHRVRVDAFYIGKYPVTQREWKTVMGYNPSRFIGDDLPVEMVSWFDTHEYLQKLSSITRKRWRLPTEAEWEYACRAGSTTDYCFGNDELQLGEYAWYCDNSGNTTHPVGQKKPNAWGLYDMHGNVWEWCQDWYDENYYANSPLTNPTGPSTGNYRAMKGGSWHGSSDAYDLRSARRPTYYFPSRREGAVGFRCVQEP